MSVFFYAFSHVCLILILLYVAGTDSPFRIDMSEFEGHDFDDGSDDLYEADNDHDVEEEGGENEESSSHNNEILANILTQVRVGNIGWCVILARCHDTSLPITQCRFNWYLTVGTRCSK